MSEKATAVKQEIDQNERVDEAAPTEFEPEDKWLVSLFTYIMYLRYQVAHELL